MKRGRMHSSIESRRQLINKNTLGYFYKSIIGWKNYTKIIRIYSVVCIKKMFVDITVRSFCMRPVSSWRYTPVDPVTPWSCLTTLFGIHPTALYLCIAMYIYIPVCTTRSSLNSSWHMYMYVYINISENVYIYVYMPTQGKSGTGTYEPEPINITFCRLFHQQTCY